MCCYIYYSSFNLVFVIITGYILVFISNLRFQIPQPNPCVSIIIFIFKALVYFKLVSIPHQTLWSDSDTITSKMYLLVYSILSPFNIRIFHEVEIFVSPEEFEL